ncbi:MAG: thiamine-phosphate kinase [Rhodospirillales bacterium]|nr:thiamine-phosphate kinase [Rhodospirillales bacterium]MDH3791059.1 thiamine-phosphate kinase [Rhodospirillales bacterium]MDH3909860.1 thiamine-phosphate kinase [Rhodospirillales bacterium]MDH3919992.1 thiamine-phosphate kinase [Rhodospirillales bacterium]MDH3966221.1 thiamine-phosphate kinase [Rhodospirillales bacterium]
MSDEFELIRRYLAPLAAGAPGALGLEDDAALLAAPVGEQLVVTADALVAGVHFLPDDPADLVARKLLRVNLSDLAAMGARPLGYVMTAAWPLPPDEAWVARFAAGLAEDQQIFGLALLGGDTTGTPGPLTLSLTAIGAVAPGRALKRSAARGGESVYVSGSIGDGVLGLAVCRGEGPALSEPRRAYLADRYRLPRPRLALGRALAEGGLSRAAIDVSDGLAADLGHILEASGLSAVVEAAALPFSEAARAALAADPALLAGLIGGGDDYELLFTAAPERAEEVAALAARLDLPLTRIGRLAEGRGLAVLDAGGGEMSLETKGWTHF